MEPDRFLGVEIRHLAALAAIERTRSFSKAGDELGYAQSAVSQQIAAIERAVGHKLVERPGGPRPVTLTEAGHVLLRHADAILARLGAAKADLDALSAGEAGSLRVGSFQSASARLLPTVLGAFRDQYPRVEVRLREEFDNAMLESLVISGELDLAFSDVSVAGPPLAWQELFDDPYVVLVPPSHPLAARQHVLLGELDGVDMISARSGTCCSDRVASSLARAHARPNVVFETDDNLTMARLVGTALGCAVMPRLAVEEDLAAASGMTPAVLPLDPRTPIVRTVGLIWHAERYRSPAARAFVSIALELAQRSGARTGEARTGEATNGEATNGEARKAGARTTKARTSEVVAAVSGLC